MIVSLSLDPIKFYSFNEVAKLSHNVLGIRRSSPPNKALRSKAVGWNVGERKHHKGRKPDWCFSNPEHPNRVRSVYRLLNDRLGHNILAFLFLLIYY